MEMRTMGASGETDGAGRPRHAEAATPTTRTESAAHRMTDSDLNPPSQAPTIGRGGVVFQRPRVKSGTATGRLPSATERSVSSAMALHAAAS